MSDASEDSDVDEDSSYDEDSDNDDYHEVSNIVAEGWPQAQYVQPFPSPTGGLISIHSLHPAPPSLPSFNFNSDSNSDIDEDSGTNEDSADSSQSGDEIVAEPTAEEWRQAPRTRQPPRPLTLNLSSTHSLYPPVRLLQPLNYDDNEDSDNDEDYNSGSDDGDNRVAGTPAEDWRRARRVQQLPSPQNPSPNLVLTQHSPVAPAVLLTLDSSADGITFRTRNAHHSPSTVFERGRSTHASKRLASGSVDRGTSRRMASHGSQSPNSDIGKSHTPPEEHAPQPSQPHKDISPNLAPPSPSSSGLMPPPRSRIDLSLLLSSSPYATAPSSPYPPSSPSQSLPAIGTTTSGAPSPVASAVPNASDTSKNDSGVRQQTARKRPQFEQLTEGRDYTTKQDRQNVPHGQSPPPSRCAQVLSSQASDASLLLGVLRSPPPVQSLSPSSIPGVPSGLPFLGLETGSNVPRFSKVNAETVSFHAESIEGDLQALRGQESSTESAAPIPTYTILEEVQELDTRVSAMEDQMKESSGLTPQSVKNVKEILSDLKRLLHRVDQPEMRHVFPYRLVLDRSLSMLAMLARSLFLLPESDDSEEHFNLSKSCLSIATGSLPEDHLAKPIIASHWGTLYLQRFQFFGQREHISQAIKFHQQSIQALSKNHPKRAMFLGWLGRSYLARFENSQDAEDLKRGIDCSSDAWKDVQFKAEKATNEERKHIFEGKGRALQCLVEYVGGLNSVSVINSGIGEWRAALLGLLKHPNTDSDIKAGCMRTLGFLYITRFDQLGGQRRNDLEKSLMFLATAATMLPKLHSDLRSTLCVLAHSLVARSGDGVHSKLAFKFLDLAKRLTPVGHAFEPHLLASFGDIHMSLSREAADSNTSAHLERAIEYHTAALRHPICHPGSRLWAKSRQRLGLCRLSKYNDLKRRMPSLAVDQLKLSLLEFMHIALSPRGHLFDRFTAACNWATNAASHPKFRGQALYGYEMAMELIPLLACFGAVPDQRRKATQKAGQLATEAAATAIEEEEYTLALTLLEQGRSVKWNHMLQLQTPLHNLKLHPEGQVLAEELEALLKGLQLEENISDDDSDRQSSHEDLCLQDRYQQVLDQIRQLRGFANFMRPKPVEDLVKAARDGPVVVINVHESRCDALVVHPIERNAGIQHIPLPELSPDGVIKMREAIDQALEEIGGTRAVGSKPGDEEDQPSQPSRSTNELEAELKNLWDWVVNPILEELGYEPRSAEDSNPNHLPRITWCATGPLSFLPLHAAGDYRDAGQKKTFEYVVSSYTPTLSALLPDSFYDVPPKPYCDLLLVNPENNASEGPGLPGAEEELDYISEHFETATSTWAARIVDKVQRFVGITSWLSPQKDQMSPQAQPDSKCSLDLEGVSDDESSESDQKISDSKRTRNFKASENTGLQDKVPLCTRLEGSDANPDQVYEEMQKHDWVHLACHAVQNDGDSARCGFYLGDELLSLQKIARMRYEKRGLAFLSACQTAKGDYSLPDEAVHLASGMLMTGYSSVIATMWPVRDIDAPEVANVVYEQLLVEEKMSCRRSAVALHLALDRLRGNGVELAYWIPFVHFGA
ncbi:unnamed protein product [Rhizoctonia solani]|uniref:CHAT domain-containing protein n=1 Tax=Rhizoctonia solani TaxID=456999 RepID=A0A8H3CTI9_9AGAM|nr:unnamed protein product [Rhizoctonia solani]